MLQASRMACPFVSLIHGAPLADKPGKMKMVAQHLLRSDTKGRARKWDKWWNDRSYTNNWCDNGSWSDNERSCDNAGSNDDNWFNFRRVDEGSWHNRWNKSWHDGWCSDSWSNDTRWPGWRSAGPAQPAWRSSA